MRFLGYLRRPRSNSYSMLQFAHRTSWTVEPCLTMSSNSWAVTGRVLASMWLICSTLKSVLPHFTHFPPRHTMALKRRYDCAVIPKLRALAYRPCAIRISGGLAAQPALFSTRRIAGTVVPSIVAMYFNVFCADVYKLIMCSRESAPFMRSCRLNLPARPALADIKTFLRLSCAHIDERVIPLIAASARVLTPAAIAPLFYLLLIYHVFF